MSAYLRPATLDQALLHLAQGDWRVLAGGTDTYVLTQDRALPFPVIDVAGLPELAGISQGPGGVRIGAGTTWAAIARADLPVALRCNRRRYRSADARYRIPEPSGETYARHRRPLMAFRHCWWWMRRWNLCPRAGCG